MSGVLFVLYIPRDSVEDMSTNNGSAEGKRQAKGHSSSKQEPKVQTVDKERTEDETIPTENTLLISNNDSNNIESKEEEKIDELDISPGQGNEEPTCTISSEYFTLEEAVQQLMIRLGITKDIWRKSDDKTSWQITFIINTEHCDNVLKRLISAGIGTIPETSVSIFPSNYHLISAKKLVSPSDENADKTLDNSSKPGDNQERDDAQEDELKEFVKSIKSRLTVAQVVEGVKANARLTFDYIALVILASIIAAIGLAENSSVVLVASMLVSPIMGPILGGTFGYVIGNRDLAKLGLQNELIGLSLCLLFGFISGIIAGPIYNGGANGSSSDMWPTAEMQGRGLTRGLGVGVAIALPSGAGVALSILGGNTGSLVGVAISASLLPPAVNAGMLWAYALVSAIKAPEVVTKKSYMDSVTALPNNLTLNQTIEEAVMLPSGCPALVNNEYEFEYSCSMPKEALILGIVSLVLTILNIICIIGMSIIVLKIKEVAPNTADSKATVKFWKNDIPVAREHYKTLKGNERMDLAKMAKDLVQESTEKKLISKDRRTRSLENIAAVRINEELGQDEKFQEVLHLMLPHARAQYFKQLSTNSDISIGNLFDDSMSGRMRHRSGTLTPSSPESDFAYASTLTPKTINSSCALKDLSGAGEKTFIYEYPKSGIARSSERKPKGLGRMMSCPEHVVLQPVDKTAGKNAGRFKITTIPEEEHVADVKRRASAVDSKDLPRNTSGKQINIFLGEAEA